MHYLFFIFFSGFSWIILINLVFCCFIFRLRKKKLSVSCDEISLLLNRTPCLTIYFYQKSREISFKIHWSLCCLFSHAYRQLSLLSLDFTDKSPKHDFLIGFYFLIRFFVLRQRNQKFGIVYRYCLMQKRLFVFVQGRGRGGGNLIPFS